MRNNQETSTISESNYKYELFKCYLKAYIENMIISR